MRYNPRNYQSHAGNHIYNNPSAGVFLDMGLGKTVITLTEVEKLMYQDLEIDKTLIIAPLRVAESVWKQEAEKWDHTKHLKISLVLGTQAQRVKALNTPADIYVINRENVAWLVSYYKSAWPFDMMIVDELSSFKSSKSIRFRALRMILAKLKRVVGLTGTPSPNGLIDLWSQIYLLDQGERLGQTVGGYRARYFHPAQTNGHIVYSYDLNKDAKESIYNKISDICISMKSKDYLDVPKHIDNRIKVKLPDDIMEKYEKFEKDQVMALINSDEEISAVNAAALTNKLLQFANGAVYDDKKKYHEIHTAKLSALEEIIDTSQGKPILVSYSYRHDLERIINKFKAKKLENNNDILDWNKGKIPLMICHPASAGHGLNLQYGGHILTWFGPTWSLELYEQFNARLVRGGQVNNVILNHLIALGTMDEDVMKAIERKMNGQNALMEAIKARIEKYT